MMVLSEGDLHAIQAAQQAVQAAELALQVVFEAENPLLGELCEGMMEDLVRINAKLKRIASLSAQ